MTGVCVVCVYIANVAMSLCRHGYREMDTMKSTYGPVRVLGCDVIERDVIVVVSQLPCGIFYAIGEYGRNVLDTGMCI